MAADLDGPITVDQTVPFTLGLAGSGTLAVKGRAPRTGYGRSLFGQAWADTDRNGCDSRFSA